MCRTNAAQLFPDSAQGFVASFLYDSYQYALLPDTASLTLRQLWARLFATSGGQNGITLENPVQLFAITTDSAVAVMVPGTTTFFRLDTPATAATVTIRFATPTGGGFTPALKSQMAVYRLPTGQ